MSLWDRVISFFGGSPDRRRIEALLERRARLAAKRELIYSEVQRLERREKELLEQGKESDSSAQKLRLAAQLAGVRKDLERRHTAAGVLNRNIDILGSHVHNLELSLGSDEARLPSREELSAAALKVDELLSRIKDDSDFVAGIDSDRSNELVSTEEADILAEFERGKADKARAAEPRQMVTPAAPQAVADATVLKAAPVRQATAVAEPPAEPAPASKFTLPPLEEVEPDEGSAQLRPARAAERPVEKALDKPAEKPEKTRDNRERVLAESD